MSVWSVLRLALLAIASLGYLANGAQAHLHVSSDATLDLMLCGTGSARTVTVAIQADPIEETEDTCCGDCIPAIGMPPQVRPLTHGMIQFDQPVPYGLPEAIAPSSPLWPGAPPHGPPSTLKATV